MRDLIRSAVHRLEERLKGRRKVEVALGIRGDATKRTVERLLRSGSSESFGLLARAKRNCRTRAQHAHARHRMLPRSGLDSAIRGLDAPNEEAIGRR